ncbi:MAG: 50S ribosomal protein L7/L12 [Candidatus Blackburnbacteria bacterium]|nr:50S ribosomal protein L7/L12 [Candidatus Blackburnbacteria bacterium]
MAEEKTKKLSEKLEKVAKQIEELSVLELSELVGALQERLGVSAIPAAAPAAPSASSGQAGEPPAEGASQGGGVATQTVVLTDSGANKIAVIKALREINPNLGLKEAKDMTEKLPATVLENVKAEEAKAASEKLQGAGAKVELK